MRGYGHHRAPTLGRGFRALLLGCVVLGIAGCGSSGGGGGGSSSSGSSSSGSSSGGGTGGGGGSTTNPGSTASTHNLYVVNNTSPVTSGLSAFTMGTGGALTPIASYTTGSAPVGVAVSPNGKFLYVTNSSSNSLSAYSIASDGTLTAITTGTLSAGSGPEGVAFSPNGNYLYVTNELSIGTNGLYAYSIDASGVLTKIGNYTTDVDPASVAISPDGNYLYTANFSGSNCISAYTVNSADGTLTGPTSITNTFCGSSIDVAITPNGKFLYLTNTYSATYGLSAFSIGTAGALTYINTYATGVTTYGLAIHPNGNFLYVANLGSGSSVGICAYTIGSTGALSPLSPTHCFASGSRPIAIAISPDGSTLYETNFGSAGTSGVSVFTIDSSGALAPATPDSYTTGASPWGIAVSP